MPLSSNARYKLLQGSFWMVLCASSAFISLFLQGRGLGTAAIGMVTAVFGVLAAILQPVLGKLCDRSARLTWRSMLLALTIPFIVVCCLLLALPGPWAGGLLIGLMMMLANLMMPFVNVASFYYRSLGQPIDFGTARGIGSGLYALLALLIGVLVQRFGGNVIPVMSGAAASMFLLATLQMPCSAAAPAAAQPARQIRRGFLKKYPAFSLMLLATLMMLTSQNIVNTYLLQIIQSLGGNSSQLGVAMAMQAIVEVPVLFCFSRIQRRYRSAALMALSSVGYAIKAILYALAGSVTMIYLIQLTQTISFALFASASVYYAAESVRAEDQTTGQALTTSMIAAGTVLGSLAGGWLLELSGVRMLLRVNVAISLAGVIIAALSLRESQKESETIAASHLSS